jgi:uncharacterized NAD(P)/FAD-binding protein YdhS
VQADYQRELDVLAQRYRSMQSMVTAVRQAVEAARAAGAPWTAIAQVVALPEGELRALFDGHVDDGDSPNGGNASP